MSNPLYELLAIKQGLHYRLVHVSKVRGLAVLFINYLMLTSYLPKT